MFFGRYTNVAAMGGSGVADAAETTAFLARTTGLDATHTNAYKALINGLVADGIFAKLDLLQIYATQDQTTANLNLVSTSYTATPQGSPTWGADVGYTTASNKYVDTGWMPTNGVQYIQDSAHVAVWSGSTGTSFRQIFNVNTANGGQTNLKPNDGGFASVQINDSSVIASQATGGRDGMFVGNRPNSTIKNVWRNGSQLGTDITRVSTTKQAFNLLTGGNTTGTGSDYAGIVRMLGAGASLTATEIGNYHTRMSAYMAAVGASP